MGGTTARPAARHLAHHRTRRRGSRAAGGARAGGGACLADGPPPQRGLHPWEQPPLAVPRAPQLRLALRLVALVQLDQVPGRVARPQLDAVELREEAPSLRTRTRERTAHGRRATLRVGVPALLPPSRGVPRLLAVVAGHLVSVRVRVRVRVRVNVRVRVRVSDRVSDRVSVRGRVRVRVRARVLVASWAGTLSLSPVDFVSLTIQARPVRTSAETEPAAQLVNLDHVCSNED